MTNSEFNAVAIEGKSGIIEKEVKRIVSEEMEQLIVLRKRTGGGFKSKNSAMNASKKFRELNAVVFSAQAFSHCYPQLEDGTYEVKFVPETASIWARTLRDHARVLYRTVTDIKYDRPFLDGRPQPKTERELALEVELTELKNQERDEKVLEKEDTNEYNEIALLKQQLDEVQAKMKETHAAYIEQVVKTNEATGRLNALRDLTSELVEESEIDESDILDALSDAAKADDTHACYRAVEFLRLYETEYTNYIDLIGDVLSIDDLQAKKDDYDHVLKLVSTEDYKTRLDAHNKECEELMPDFTDEDIARISAETVAAVPSNVSQDYLELSLEERAELIF